MLRVHCAGWGSMVGAWALWTAQMEQTQMADISSIQQQRGGYALAQEVTGLKYGTLTALVSQRRIPHSRVSSRIVLFDRRELEEWLRAHAVPPTGLLPRVAGRGGHGR